MPPRLQSSRECGDHSGHLHCYRSNLVNNSGDSAEKVTVGVSANGGSGGEGGGGGRKRKKQRRKKKRSGGGDTEGQRQTG